MEELQAIQEQIIKLCAPQKILLFGSRTKGTSTAKSDIDLCIIALTTNKRTLLTDLYCDTQSDIPVDFLLYTPEEWDQCVSDCQSFAYQLNQKGGCSLWVTACGIGIGLKEQYRICVERN